MALKSKSHYISLESIDSDDSDSSSDQSDSEKGERGVIVMGCVIMIDA